MTLSQEKTLWIASLPTTELNNMLNQGMKNAAEGNNLLWIEAIMNELNRRELTR